MASLVAQAAKDHSFNEVALRQSLSDIAQHSHASEENIGCILEEGWKQGAAQAMTDGIISRPEEERLRAFRTTSPWRAATRTPAPWPNWTGPVLTGSCWK